MHAGQLNERISIQRKTSVDHPLYGQQPGGWETIYTRIPAQVMDDLPSKTESVQGGMRMSAHPARVRMRYLPGIKSDMRVVRHSAEGDEIYQIDSTPAMIGQREWTEFTIRNYAK